MSNVPVHCLPSSSSSPPPARPAWWTAWAHIHQTNSRQWTKMC